jgi:hypothetical protein
MTRPSIAAGARLLGAALGYLAIPAACAAPAPAPPAPPPPLLGQKLAEADCAAPQWTNLPGESWLADCASPDPRRPGARMHRLFAFHRAGGDKARSDKASYGMQKLVEYPEPDDSRPKTRVELRAHGTRVALTVSTEFGSVHARTWELAALPAALVEESEGGNKPCREAMALHGAQGFANADMAEARCTTDFVKKRQSCVRDHPECRKDPTRLYRLSYVAIPMHSNTAKLRGHDLWSCATTIGLEKEDVVAGDNGKQTTFQIVGEEDVAAEWVRFHLRIADKTPHFADPSGKDWQASDHLEIYLASDRDDVTCGERALLDEYCKALLLRFKMSELVVAPLADHKSFLIFPSTMKPSPPRSPSVQARWEGQTLVLELRGPAFQSAHQGALTFAYSDSVDGKRQRALIAMSPISDAPGRVGDYALCDAPDARPAEVVTIR